MAKTGKELSDAELEYVAGGISNELEGSAPSNSEEVQKAVCTMPLSGGGLSDSTKEETAGRPNAPWN